MIHMRRAENPYLGFLFRCYSDPSYQRKRIILDDTDFARGAAGCYVDTYVREELGVARFEVDAQGHEPGVARRRPDRAARIKALHAAAEHDRWFREQVEIGIKEADAPDAEWIPHEEVMGRLDARIARLKKRDA